MNATASGAGFVHLHAHSYYSLLEACPSPADLVRAAAQVGMPALALTDSNALYGAIEFYTACLEAGIRPIVGMELAVCAREMALAGGTAGNSRHQNHLDAPDSAVLLARDLEGYANLCRLSSALQTRPDREAALQQGLPPTELEGRTGGLIALSGGKNGLLHRLVRAGQLRDAEAAASTWAERFGRDNFYIELQIQSAADVEISAILASLAGRLGLGTVAGCNVHYLAPADEPQCRLLDAMGTIQPLERVSPRPGLHFASPDEMLATFVDFPDALANTVTIADRCRLDLPLGEPVFPEIGLPTGETSGDVLRARAFAGAGERYSTVDDAVCGRLDHELAIIDGLGYAPLFIIVADVVQYARQQGIPVNLRGSAAGSVVAYCLGISSVDPIELDLYFERFLNPERRDPPDIDLDLCSRRRDEVIRYIYRRYGHDRVATICTYARLRARSAWREVAKAHGLPQARITSVAREVPRSFHPGMWSQVQEAKERVLSRARDRREREALAAAWALDGYPRHLSVHPGGVVIAPGPLTDLVPLQLATKGVIITQYDLHSIEKLGLVKIDLLGIRALTVVAESTALIQRREPRFSPESIPDGDAATGDMLARADSIGCFQTESPGMRRTLRELGARTIPDLTVSLALYKPGPLRGGLKDAFVRRHRGDEAPSYLHPALGPILESTYGVVLYQEQVLRIVHELAGFSLGEADRFRRAIGHLGHGDEMLPLRSEFIERVGNVSGIPGEIAERLWDLLFSFAGYGFLKAHAASYATVAYQTAYLKAHYPAEFMCAIVRNWGGYYPQRLYLGEARRLGLALHPPHVNHSGRRFELVPQPDGQQVLWMGLGQVRELRQKTIAEIIQARQDRPFDSLGDLLRRARPRRTEAENLVKAGALDGLGGSRKSLLAELEGRTPSAPLQMAFPVGWMDGSPGEDESLLERLAMEVEMLGWPVSTHPLAPFAPDLVAQGVVQSSRLAERSGQRVAVAGARLGLWGESQGHLTLEDQTGLLRLRLQRGQRLKPGPLGKLGPYSAHGRVRVDPSGGVSLLAERVDPLE